MQLSRRMQRLASLVTEGNRLADVGTDHGYVPIALVRERKIPSAVAMDVNKGPLARAEEHIREAGLSTYIRLRRSDGLQELQAGEADTILIAGMGGMLMVRILEEGGHCLDTAEELILQPQSDIYMVRRWLSEHRFQILLEDIVEEDGKYYPMLKAVHGQERELTEPELYYGKREIQNSPEILRRCLQARLSENRKILGILKQSQKEKTRRACEIESSIKIINFVLAEFQGSEKSPDFFEEETKGGSSL